MPLLLETKLFPGAGTGYPVQRPRLEPPPSILEGQCNVAVMIAPAGYGKSTLMARWVQRLREVGVNCAWLTLDENDNDSVRLFNYLVAALQAQGAKTGANTLRQANRQVDAGEFGLLVQTLAAELSASGQRLCLFLDNLHVLHDPGALRIMQWLIDYAPSRMQLVLSARDLSRLQLSGLRLSGRLVEIDQRQLMFNMEEADRFYGARLSEALSQNQLRQLMEKTEGWAAGMQLAALALEGEARRQDVINGFTGSDLGVVEYLGDMVLSHLDEQTRQFLHVVAQFDRISGALAASASELADARERLAGLYARGLFLIALDRRGEWFRFHHLAGEFFRARTPPGLPPGANLAAEALLRGARWLYGEGLVEEAIDCAIRARQWECACAWISERIVETLHSRGSHQLVLRWMREIPQPWLDRYPIISAHHILSLTMTHQHQKAKQALARLEGVLPPINGDQQEAAKALRRTVELQHILLIALCGDGRQARDMAYRWEDRWPGAPLVEYGCCKNLQAWGYKCCGEIDAGLNQVAQARQIFLPGKHFYGLSWSAGIESMLYMKRGNYAAARASCMQGLELLTEGLAGGGAQRCVFEVNLAAVSYEFNEIVRAREELDRGLTDLWETAPVDWLILAYLTQARLMMLSGDTENALSVLREGQVMARSQELSRLEITLAAEQCVWLCRRGQWEQAEALARSHGIERIADPALPHTVTSDKSLRVGAWLTLTREPENVARMLALAIADAHARGLAHREIELRLLYAAALRQAGRKSEIQEALATAVRLGRSHGYRRVFLDDADLLYPMLTQTNNEDVAWLRTLLKTGEAPAQDNPDDIELTNRELRIIAILESGLNNRQIAEALFISESTLKWHLYNIYSKLGVRNRSGAIKAGKLLRQRQDLYN